MVAFPSSKRMVRFSEQQKDGTFFRAAKGWYVFPSSKRMVAFPSSKKMVRFSEQQKDSSFSEQQKDGTFFRVAKGW